MSKTKASYCLSALKTSPYLPAINHFNKIPGFIRPIKWITSKKIIQNKKH